MNLDGLEEGSSEIQLKKQVACIMSCFQNTIQSYASNRRQLQLVLNQLLKAHRSFRIHKNQSQILSSLNNKEDVYFEYYLLNNIACCYQTKRQFSKALQYLKQADKELSRLQQLIQKSEFDYETRKIELINIHMRMIKAKLNLCGIYAISQKHMQALYQCTQAFGILQKVIDSVCDYSMGQKNHQDFLQLQKCIKQPYSEIKELQIRNLYWNKVMNGQTDDQVRDIFLTLFSNCTSKQQVQVRSCLGKIITKNISKTQIISENSRKYLKQFTIGSVMRISPLNLEDFSKNKQKDDYISLRFMHQLMILMSVANYTVSTQLRIANMCEIQSPTLESVSAQQENNLYKKQKRMMEAERHHFFSIQLMYRIASGYVKQCPFFSRLIKIYEQVYILKDNIEIIPEKVQEQNQISMMPNEPKFNDEDQYFGKKFKQSICQTPKVKKITGSQKELLKLKRKQKQQSDIRKKKSVKKNSITKHEYLCMSPRNTNNSRLPSEQKKIRTKNKSTQKITGSSMIRKSKGEMTFKSPRKGIGY